MVGKTAVAASVLVTLFVLALFDKYFVPLAVILCCIVVYFCFKKLLKTWIEDVLSRAERTQLRYSRHHHRKKAVKLRSTFASGIFLPWIEKVVSLLVAKFKQKPPTENEYDQDDFSPSSEYSYGFPVDLSNAKFCGNSPTETNEIKSFVNHISQSYIRSWYKSISKHDEFVQDLDYILEDVLVNLCGRISKLNVNQLFNQIFVLVHNHILKYYENAFEDYKSQGTNFRKKENYQVPQLHPALKSHKTEMVYLSTVCETLVDYVGPQDILLCPLIRNLLTEILTKNLLFPAVNLVSDPAFLFWSIVFFFGDSNQLNRISRTIDVNTTCQRESTTLKRNLELNLTLKNTVKQRLHKVYPHTMNCKGKLAKARSLSYNSLLEMDQNEMENTEKDGVVPNSPNRVTSDSNLFSLANEIQILPELWDKNENDEYYVSRPPFSLFPVPGHSSRAEQAQANSRKSSPTRLFQRLPKKKSKCLPRSSSLHSSQSLDELLLPPNKVFQPNGTHILPSREPSPAPTFSLEVEQAEEATEAADVQQFYNIRIVGTNELYDSARKKYILYCIQYDYLEPAIDELKENETRSLVPCTAVVRRRFREFLALQSRLEKSKLKRHLSGIKGPSKWLSSPFPATDKRNVEKRRLFLQGYLQKLCSKEALANTPELHEFLAYKGDARIAFVKKAPELPVPRIDKMVVKCVMGTIDLLKTALPSMPQESPSSGIGPKIGPQGDKAQQSTRSILTGFTRNKSDTKLHSMEFVCRVERVSPLSQHIYNFLDSFDTSSSPEDSRPNSPTPFRADSDPSQNLLTATGPAWKRAASRLDILQSLPPPPGPRLRGDGCDSLDLTREESDRRASQIDKIQESFQTEIPLSNTLVDMMLCIFFPMHALSDDYAVVAFKVIFGDLLQKWLQKELHCLSSQEKCIEYLHNLHEILWPPSGQSTPKIRELETCMEAASQTLMGFFPGKLTLLLGMSDVGINIATALDCLRNNQANRNLLYQVIDVVTDMMCAQDLQHSAL